MGWGKMWLPNRLGDMFGKLARPVGSESGSTPTLPFSEPFLSKGDNMRRNIFGFDQELMPQGLDFLDYAILDDFICWASLGKMDEITTENGRAYWLNHQAVADWYPRFGVSARAVGRHLAKMVDAGLLWSETVNTARGRRAYYGFAETVLSLRYGGYAAHETAPHTATKSETKDASKQQEALFDVPVSKKMRLGDFKNVPFTEDELAKLKVEFPYDWEERIERVSNWSAAKGRKVKNGLATIRNWARRDSRPSVSKAPAAVKTVGNVHPDAERAVKQMVDVLRFNWRAMVCVWDDHQSQMPLAPWKEPEITGDDIANASQLLSEGRTVNDFRKVAIGQLVAWGSNDAMCRNLQPKTLLKPEPFERYLSAAPANVYRYAHGELPMYHDGRTLLKWQESPRERFGEASDDEMRAFLDDGGVEMKEARWVRESHNLKGGYEMMEA